MSDLRFDGQVAIVTGAGRGIGRAHALLLAERGAHIVVNDLGCAVDGFGQDESYAEQTAAAIADAGGSAEANHADIATSDGAYQLVEQALKHTGHIEALVNNAGIHGTDAFPNVTVEDMQRFHSVHVGGTFNVTQAVWPHMTQAGYGRVVTTTSTGALGMGNLTRYGTAKAGVLGLTRALAMVGAEHGIKVNGIAPLGATRMVRPDATAINLPEIDPAMVSPMVAVLSHPECPTTGEIYTSAGGRYARIIISETLGWVHRGVTTAAPEEVLIHWDEINDLTSAEMVTDTNSWSRWHHSILGH